MMKQIHIHFVGYTDQYRSRIAVSYMRRLVPSEWHITSSGAKTTISQASLDEANIVVFLEKAAYDHALKLLNIDARKMIVWDILSMTAYAKRYHLNPENDDDREQVMQALEKSVRKHCDELLTELHTTWVDVVDRTNIPSGLILPIDWVTKRGLWHRSAHVLLMTPHGDVLVEKRSPIITFAPGALEITLGGIVDAGETPLHAAIRETYEELGIRVDADQFRRVMVTRQNSWHPSYHRHTRSIKYVFAARLRPDQMLINTDPLEVGGVAILSPHELRTLLRTHRVRHIGHLATAYKFYRLTALQSLRVLRKSKPLSRHRHTKDEPKSSKTARA